MAQNFVDVGKTEAEQVELLEIAGLNAAQIRHCLESKRNYMNQEKGEEYSEGKRGAITQEQPTQATMVPRPGMGDSWAGVAAPITHKTTPLKI